ncbi:methyltransferase RsmF C-terminal domain-like protein [Lachnobacterium bovis]|uniref:methyltransferase RsmF C-terminal domain-like protein n=1 Tax=Lachnobacterium bovis TaxID=140626 RepID=UPI00048B2725
MIKPRNLLLVKLFLVTKEKGWYLITVNGYSLGWGKMAGKVMKNHYPKGLRKKYPITQNVKVNSFQKNTLTFFII